MASKYHRRLGFRSGQSSGGEDASWVEAKAALKTLTPLSRVHLTLEDTRGPGADGAPVARYRLVVVDRRVKVRKKPLAAFIVGSARPPQPKPRKCGVSDTPTLSLANVALLTMFSLTLRSAADSGGKPERTAGADAGGAEGRSRWGGARTATG